MNETDLKNRLGELDSEYITFLKSDFIQKISELIENEMDFPQDKSKHLSNALMKFMLISLNVEDFIDFLKTECELEAEQAYGIAGVFFHGLPDDMLGAQSKAYVEMHSEKTEEEKVEHTTNNTLTATSQADLLKR